MTAAFTRAISPILKIRAALRERTSRPEYAAGHVVSITDALMLGWAESEVKIRVEARSALAAVQDELADLRKLVGALLEPEREVSALEKLLVFTKLESASGLARQASNAMALCCVALVLWFASIPDCDRNDMLRAPRVRVRREGCA